jgi:type I restriction enzyme S subunit
MSVKLRPYPEYKESGVHRVGPIPGHWQTCALKRVCRLCYGDALPSDGRMPGPVPVYGSNGRVGWHTTPNTDGCCLIIGRKGSFGKVTYSARPSFAIDTTYFVDHRHTSNYLRWLYYALLWAGLDDCSRDSAVPGLDKDDANSRMIPLPSLQEQRHISAFLDLHLVHTDHLIRAKRRQIELLNEQKQAIINSAVTRGLDPNPRLKPSGVEWPASIPSHWQVTRLKNLARFLSGGTPSTSSQEFWNGSIPWVSPKDMKGPCILDAQDHVTELALAERALPRVPSGSMLIVVRSGILRRQIPVAITDCETTINQDMKAVICDHHRLVPEFLMMFIVGNQRTLLSIWRKHGATVESLESDWIRDTYVPVPPMEEQHSIVQELLDRTKAFDSASALIGRQISLLLEYRTRLIADVVTGKLDVRGVELPDLEGIAVADDFGDSDFDSDADQDDLPDAQEVEADGED